MKHKIIMPESVRGVRIAIACSYCNETGGVPGSLRQYGDIVPCPVCNGTKVTGELIPLSTLAVLLEPHRPARGDEET